MTATFVPLHIAPDTKRLPATCMRALEWLFSGVAVAVDPETARPRKRLVAGLADVSILRLRVGRLTRRTDVVVMLPRVSTGGVGWGCQWQ
jgi:hypothetical protein